MGTRARPRWPTATAAGGPVNRLADEQRYRLAELAQARYAGFNQPGVPGRTETLAEEELDLAVSPRPLCRLLAKGLGNEAS